MTEAPAPTEPVGQPKDLITQCLDSGNAIIVQHPYN